DMRELQCHEAAERVPEEDEGSLGLHTQDLVGVVRRHLLHRLERLLRPPIAERADAVDRIPVADGVGEILVDVDVARAAVETEDGLPLARRTERDDAAPLPELAGRVELHRPVPYDGPGAA